MPATRGLSGNTQTNTHTGRHDERRDDDWIPLFVVSDATQGVAHPLCSPSFVRWAAATPTVFQCLSWFAFSFRLCPVPPEPVPRLVPCSP